MAIEKIVFPMVGKVVSVDVKVGDTVQEDDTLGTFESMKIEMPLAAPCSGTVREVKVAVGDVVEADDVFGTIEK